MPSDPPRPDQPESSVADDSAPVAPDANPRNWLEQHKRVTIAGALATVLLLIGFLANDLRSSSSGTFEFVLPSPAAVLETTTPEAITSPSVSPEAASTDAPTPGLTSAVTEQDPAAEDDCDPSYPDVCIPPPPPTLRCEDIAETDFTVVGLDPHGFDGNFDGIGCES